MDEKIKSVIEKKINETLNDSNAISILSDSFGNLSKSKRDFCNGIIIGRLYNSFYYQYRRIVKRDPTEEEFSEFIQILKQHEKEFLGLSF